jgi:flagellar protein FlaJ
MFPFITAFRGDILARMLNTFWIVIAIPILTFLLVYIYPVMERRSIETKISQELPFATIHMSSIAESMVEPSNIFSIMVKTKEYPVLEKEFTKLLNEINVFGRDLVTALRNSAFNSPSRRLAELFDGLATTITSGGDMSNFFDKRAQSLLFEYRLEKEKKTKSAETFMDIYISVVIAAPMILMLLLIMMRVSGLGIALSTGMISLIMVLGVSFINIVFLVFLHLKGST